MNYFGMSYNEVLDSPFQRLVLLAKSIPKYSKKSEAEETAKGIPLSDFAKQNNLLNK